MTDLHSVAITRHRRSTNLAIRADSFNLANSALRLPLNLPCRRLVYSEVARRQCKSTLPRGDRLPLRRLHLAAVLVQGAERLGLPGAGRPLAGNLPAARAFRDRLGRVRGQSARAAGKSRPSCSRTAKFVDGGGTASSFLRCCESGPMAGGSLACPIPAIRRSGAK